MLDAYPEARWLAEKSTEGATWSYNFSCPPEPRGRYTLSVAAYSSGGGGGGGGEKGSWCK